MNPEFDEVLLTAYLDDEVTGAERKAVEEQLRTSASSRKLLEELRSVRNLVMQLHQSQPSRSFQSGPWNETAMASESAKVVLNESHATWNSLIRRLASIAALIAITVCGSLLVIRPNGMSLSRSEKKDTFSDIEVPAIRAEKPLDQPMLPGRMNPSNSLSLEMEKNEQQKPGATEAEGVLAKSEAAVASMSSMAKKNSETALRSLGEASAPPPAPMVARGTGTALLPSFGTPGSLVTEAKTDDALNPLVQALLRSLAAVSTENQSDWVAVNALDQQRSLGRPAAIDSKTLYSFRYTKATEKESIEDKSNNLQKSQADEFSMRWAAEAKEIASAKEVPSPSFIELQIPSQDWVAGAQRLRELGIDVPLELPSVDYVDFKVSPMPDSNDGVNLLGSLGKAKQSEELLRWRFGRAEPQARVLASETAANEMVASAEKGIALPAAGKDLNDAPPFAWIRVRAIKKE